MITFQTGAAVRRALTSRMAAGQPVVTVGRPCNPGNNGNDALQNIKDWAKACLAAVKQHKEEMAAGEHALAFGNLTQDEYNALALVFSFTQGPARTWGVANVVSNNSLGAIIGVTGAGVGTAIFTKLASVGFQD